LSSARVAGGARRLPGRGRSHARKAHRADRARGKGRALTLTGCPDGTAHRRKSLALPHVFPRGVGSAARRHADDTDLGRGHALAFAARPSGYQGSRRYLSTIVAVAFTLRGGDPA